MEDNPITVLTISNLIKSGRPFTAASSLVPSRPIDLRNQNPCSRKPICQSPNLQTLKPFNHPALLIGVVILPSPHNPLQCNCFQFSDDDSTTICCEILDFDMKMVGQKIRILAWNFIPFERGYHGGFLEIIRWDFIQSFSGGGCPFSDFSCFCLNLGSCDIGDSSMAHRLVFGVIMSISPVSTVPWASGGGDSRGVKGFLVHILVCKCTNCASKHLVSELKGLCERNVKDHSFIQSTIVYFCGLTSSWHPVISRLIGNVVLLRGLKKKLVYLRKEESQLMYVSTDGASLHVAKLSKEPRLTQYADIRGKGECGSYTGVITGIYMDGQILELDQDVMLLLTDQYLAFPHYVRVGVVVTMKNVHFVDPCFPWGKMLILGACTRTSMHVESFSPLQSWCHLKKQYPSHLQKFINSLPYAARLWTLLVVSCFGKMFAGILSMREILGSQHKEGLAQKHASLHLPSSAFQTRHGVLLEFCRHDLCFGDKEVDCGHLRLALPIANLVSYCEALWKKIFNSQENCPDNMGAINQKSLLCCGGRSYVKSNRRVLCSEEIGVVVLGTLKISSYSGKLQLVDATGSIDFMPNLPETWDFKRIFEVKDFRLIIEGTCPELVDSNPTTCQPLSCQSIFSNALPSRKFNLSIDLYHCPSGEDSRSRSLFFDWKGNSQDLNSGKYHLLWLSHKFPIQKKFLGDLAKRPNMFAEAIVLPWDLLVAGKYRDAIMTRSFSGHWQDSFKNLSPTKEHLTFKRCKNEHTSQVSSCCTDDAGIGQKSQCDNFSSYHCNSYTENRCSNNGIKVSCQNTGEGVHIHRMGMLHCACDHVEILSSCKPARRKVLLEFSPECFSKYELLKIGCCYLVKHEEGDMLCCKEKSYQVSCAKVFVGSGTHFRSLTLSSTEGLQSADLSDGFPFCNLHVSGDDLTKDFCRFEIPCLIGNSTGRESYSDINIFVPSSAVNLLDKFMKIMGCISHETRDSFEEESSNHDNNGSMINSSMQSSGTSCSYYPLPQGNLITLCGLVLAFHDCHGVDFLAQPGRCRDEGSKLMFLQEKAGICVHVSVDNHTVRIFCDRSKETCPTGLGRGAYATFHRVLLLSELDKYMMTAVSFITVDHASLMREHHVHELRGASRTVGSHIIASQDTVSITLIYDALQLSDLRLMRFRCKVVALYILVLEKAGSTAVSQSRFQSIRSAFGIPFAGFVVDDGSSSCCCWADSETAAAFLGLDSEEYSLKDTLAGCEAGKGQLHISTVGHLSQALKRHGRILAKNCSSMFDSSCQDLEFSVDSKRSLSSVDEDNLQSLITKALLTASWTVDGSLMDPKKASWLEKRLSELDVAVPPLLNIWATRVCRTDTLSEARGIVGELV